LWPGFQRRMLPSLKKKVTLDLSKFRNCEACRRTPEVFVTDEKVGVCRKHWSLLAESDVEW
jgi:hypothetical protein